MVAPKTKSPSKRMVLLSLPLVLVLIFVFFVIRSIKANTTKLDQFPIWVLDDGTAVYREMEVSPGKVKKTILLDVPDENSGENVQIYESIPKEIAESASDLSFSVKPEIVEDDPLVLWSVNTDSKTRELSWTEKATLLPRLGIFVAQTIGRAAVGKLTGACNTQTAQEWMKKNSYSSEPNAIDCAKYVEHINEEVQERQTVEWQNKLEEGKIKRSVQPEDDDYEEYKGRFEIETKSSSTKSGSSSWDGEYAATYHMDCENGYSGDGTAKYTIKDNEIQSIEPERTLNYGKVDSSGHAEAQGSFTTQEGNTVEYSSKFIFSRSGDEISFEEESSSINYNKSATIKCTATTTATRVGQ